MRVTKEFLIEAAHNIQNYQGKCERLHGHSYRLQVTVAGSMQSDGMIMDFTQLRHLVHTVIDPVDHSYLNDFLPLSTTEHFALWLWQNLEPLLCTESHSLDEIKLWETQTSYVTLCKDDFQ